MIPTSLLQPGKYICLSGASIYYRFFSLRQKAWHGLSMCPWQYHCAKYTNCNKYWDFGWLHIIYSYLGKPLHSLWVCLDKNKVWSTPLINKIWTAIYENLQICKNVEKCEYFPNFALGLNYLYYSVSPMIFLWIQLCACKVSRYVTTNQFRVTWVWFVQSYLVLCTYIKFKQLRIARYDKSNFKSSCLLWFIHWHCESMLFPHYKRSKEFDARKICKFICLDLINPFKQNTILCANM